MKKLFIIGVLSWLLQPTVTLGQHATLTPGHYNHHGSVYLPDDIVTPGVIRTTDETEICDPKFRTEPFRKTTPAMKTQVYREYGVKRGTGICVGGCEVDHRLPLELGGLDDIRNLWPQPSRPVPGFHEKDLLENHLKYSVCTDKTMTLKEAQADLLGDWYTAYLIECARGCKVGQAMVKR